jgi:hypothetical protein
MNEAMEMLRELIEKVGMTGEQAWPYVVRHVQMDALISVVAGAVAGLVIWGSIAGMLITSRIRWKQDEKDNSEVATGLLVASLATLVIVGWLPFVVLIKNLPDLIEPTGATIREIVGK